MSRARAAEKKAKENNDDVTRYADVESIEEIWRAGGSGKMSMKTMSASAERLQTKPRYVTRALESLKKRRNANDINGSRPRGDTDI